MLILGLNKSRHGIDYALVEDGVLIKKQGQIPETGTENILAAITERTGVSTDEITAVAIANEDLLELDGSLPVIKLNPEDAEKYSPWLHASSEHAEPIRYPQLVWVEKPEASEIHLQTGPFQSKVVAGHAGKSITKLLQELADLLGSSELAEMALQGDEQFHNFKRHTANEEHKFDLNYLSTELKPLIAAYLAGEDSSQDEDLRQELFNFWSYDMAASLQESIFESIVLYLISVAYDLGVTSLAVVGDLAYNPRLRIVLSNTAPELDYEVRFPEIDMETERAAALAGLAFHKLNT